MRAIQKLSSQLANQIAAGEVVERPASVLKELLENSLDAGAKRIDIEVEQGGVQLIRVRDDGHGINKEDLTLAIASHATSKIYEIAELSQVESLGFRGEALASIGAVSRMTVCSKPKAQDMAWQVSMHGRDPDAQVMPAAHPDGSTVTVKDLFFNTPARRKFLRSDKTEYSVIEDMVKRIALSHTDCAITMKHNQRQVLRVQGGADIGAHQQRVAQIFGKSFLNSAIHVETSISGLRLWGWMSDPEYTRSQRDQQYFYVNGRMIKDKVVMHAVTQAYQDRLYTGRFPVYVLYLEIDPASVDVNVHPTKHEVRFRQARLVHDFIATSLQQALQPQSDLSACTVTEEVSSPYQPPASAAKPKPQQVQQQLQAYQTLSHQPQRQPQAAIIKEALVSDSKLGNLLGCSKQGILIADGEQGLVLVNIDVVTKQVFKQQLAQDIEQQQLVSQPLLIPQTVTLSDGEMALYNKHQTLWAQLAMDINQITETQVILRKLPSLLRDADADSLFHQLLMCIGNDKPASQLTQVIDVLATHAASSQCQALSLNAQKQLLLDIEKHQITIGVRILCGQSKQAFFNEH